MHTDVAQLGRIAIVNRGEPAMRAIHAIRELSDEYDANLHAVAMHTAVEHTAMFVREADDAVQLGPDLGVASTGIPYLDLDLLRSALVRSRADTVWVGWGFVAENAAFADLCAELGVTFVGPTGDVMRALGDKIGAKQLAEQAGVPVAPWSGGAVESVDEAFKHGDNIGYPLVVKASAGGGGRGIRRVESRDELAVAFERAREEALRSFGDATVFMERLVSGARHIEVQVIADNHGTVWTPGVRDCSVQRRNQKVLEESSSPALSDNQAQELAGSAAQLARTSGYTNAGTVEFLYQPQSQQFAFLEVNTRLQVEHPVTELTAGIDLVKLQLLVAAGGRLDGPLPAATGHAIEVRLNAEDAERGFAPAPGTIERLRLPAGPGIRVDTGVSEGDVIPPEYDSMIAKIIAVGATRQEAMAKLKRALRQTSVLVRGGTTNRAFLLGLLDEAAVIAGEVDTSWLDRRHADGTPLFDTRGDVALVAAAVRAYEQASRLERDRFYASAARGRPQVSTDLGIEVDLRYAGTTYRTAVLRTGQHRYLVSLNGDDHDRVDVVVEPLQPYEQRLTINGQRFRIASIAQGADLLVEVDGIPHRISQDDAGLVRAPGPSVVIAVQAAVGDHVTAGAPVAVLESMKMETVITAPFAGIVRDVFASGNVQLDAGAPIVRLEPLGDTDDSAPTGGIVDFARLRGEAGTTSGSATTTVTGDASNVAESQQLAVAMLRRLVLGYDIPTDSVNTLLDAMAPATEVTEDELRSELHLLRMFADLTALTRNRRIGDASDIEQEHSSKEYLHAFLRSLDPEIEGLPESFRSKLRRALAGYNISDFERSEALEEAMYRIYLAQQRTAAQVPVILALLERRMDAPVPQSETVARELRETLDELVLATQVRHPVIGDLARRVRYRAFDQPRLLADRERVYTQVREHLHAISELDRAGQVDDPNIGASQAGTRAEHLDALVNATQPLLGLLVDPVVVEGGHAAMLEVLTRRYYRTRQMESVTATTVDGLAGVIGEFIDRDGRGRVVGIAGDDDKLEAVLAAGAALAQVDDAQYPSGVVADLYITRDGKPQPVDDLARRLDQLVNADAAVQAMRRVTLSVSTPSAEGGIQPHVDHLTFRQSGDGTFVEQRHLRGIHPLIAGRLDLWRFEKFDLERLPSSDGVYVFDATARATPADRRLFVLAEVRDLTPVRDDQGRIRALPELEYVMAACLDDLRQARATYATDQRPEWNRVILNVWPEVQLSIREVHGVIRALAPMTEGLGLEQVTVKAQMPGADGAVQPLMVRMSRPPGQGLTVRVTPRPSRPLEPFDELTQKVLSARRRGTVYPFEIVPMITRSPDIHEETEAEGSFVEYDFVDDTFAPVDRKWGSNTAGVVVGTVTTPTVRYPEGMTRVAIFGDPTKGLGSLAEAESRRVIAALDLAESLGVPVEWFAVSSGARIAMDSGTENMDWVSRVLRRIVEFTQQRGEINVIVTGINVGAQPYWNAEATMLMHTRGILVMTPDSAMVLTGKQALDYSGGVSAEDNFGIGGYDRVMGPNGQAQYWAADLTEARDILFAHYAHSYVAPGERFPRRAATTDPIDRDIRIAPHRVEGVDFTTVGDIFSDDANPGRKKPFDIRTLLRAVADQDYPTLERWKDMADAQSSVVLDAHLGGYPVTLLGFESRPIPRRGPLPADGPDQWTGGTLFPRSSKKTARAINAASGNRPVVVLANLSGFDGSPESLRQLQLEYGAEIGRAVVNFDGPIVFCVVSRYHGGAFVVFSRTLNDSMEIAAVEGSHASVIGGPPAAAVVFAGDVNRRTNADERVRALEAQAHNANDDAEAARLRAELHTLRVAVRSEKLGEVAAEFDQVHSVQRARRVGSIDTIISAETLRPYVISAVERGIERTLANITDHQR